MKMHEKELFVLRYFTTILPDIDNKKLSKEVMSNPNKIVNSPYHTNFEDFDLILTEGGEAIKLMDTVNEIAKPWNLSISGFWSHVHLPLESTERHNHDSSRRSDAISWVYYVSTPDRCGDLVFVLHDLIEPAIIKPIEGMLVMFPSYLDHKVTKNLSKDVRISISGNLL